MLDDRENFLNQWKSMLVGLGPMARMAREFVRYAERQRAEADAVLDEQAGEVWENEGGLPGPEYLSCDATKETVCIRLTDGRGRNSNLYLSGQFPEVVCILLDAANGCDVRERALSFLRINQIT